MEIGNNLSDLVWQDINPLSTLYDVMTVMQPELSVDIDITTLSNDVAGLSSNKLDKSEFAALSNEIGLSAATSSNSVVTKDDIKNLAGAMHFKGAVTDLSTVTSADPGDVVIIIETSKEYVYNGKAGEEYLSTNWVELGDITGLGDLAFSDQVSASYTPQGTISAAFSGTSFSSTGNFTPQGEISAKFTGTSFSSTGNFTP